MNLRGTLLKVTVLLAMISQPAFALINAELFMGSSSVKFKAFPDTKEGDLSGTHMNVSVLVDPIPLVPVAFGLGIQQPTLTGKIDGNEYDLKGVSFDLLVKAWSPVSLSGFTPYGKLALTIAGGFKSTWDGNELVYKNSGTSLALGVSYSVIPLVAVLFELGMPAQDMEVDSAKGKDVPTTVSLNLQKGKKGTLSGTNLLIGVQAGI